LDNPQRNHLPLDFYVSKIKSETFRDYNRKYLPLTTIFLYIYNIKSYV